MIPEGKEREVLVHFYLSTTFKREDPLNVHLVVEDNLANKHKPTGLGFTCAHREIDDTPLNARAA